MGSPGRLEHLKDSQRIWAVNPRVTGFGLPATDYDLPFKGIALS